MTENPNGAIVSPARDTGRRRAGSGFRRAPQRCRPRGACENQYRKLLGNLNNAIEALCGRPGAGLDGDPAAAARERRERAAAEGVAGEDAGR